MVMQKIPFIGLVLLLTIVGSLANAVVEPACPTPPEGQLSRAFFPPGFIFGTATSAYQVEGAVYENSRGRSMWDVFCVRYPSKCENHTGEVAVDFFHRYPEDIQRMKELNTDAFRMSIAWPRIFPYGKKERGISKSGVEFYHALIDQLKKNGIEPFVTVFHWDTPQDLEDEYGGFLSKNIVKDFRDYAEFVFQEYGEKVKNWITFNEPWVFAHAGYDVGKKAPGRCSKYIVNSTCHAGESGHEAYIVSHNLLNAHAEAVEAFRACEKCKGGKIGIAHSPAWFEPHHFEAAQGDDTHESTKRALDFMLGWHLEPTMYGDYPQIMKDVIGDSLPKFTFNQSEKLKGSTDFLGLNYYSAKFQKLMDKNIRSQPRWMQDSGYDWEEDNVQTYILGTVPKTALKDMVVYSRGFRSLLKYIKKEYKNPEIMIMENGYGEILGQNDTRDLGTNDTNRKYYFQRHLLSLYEAICVDKVNVKGYFVWSLLDNFEWQMGYTARFGLYYVDFKDKLSRHLKLSGMYIKEFLSKSVTPSEVEKKSKEKDEL